MRDACLRALAAGDTRCEMRGPRVTRPRRSAQGASLPRVSDPLVDPTRV